MPRRLHTESLRDAGQYAEAERYWQSLFDDVVRGEGVESEWRRPWLATRFSDGTRFGDGNPIFSAWSPGRLLSVRVIQDEPGSEGDDLHSWLDTFEAQEGPIRELVISCVLSEDSAARAVELIRS